MRERVAATRAPSGAGAGFLQACRLSGDVVATSGDASDLRRGGFGPASDLRPWLGWEAGAGKFVSEEDEAITGCCHVSGK